MLEPLVERVHSELRPLIQDRSHVGLLGAADPNVPEDNGHVFRKALVEDPVLDLTPASGNGVRMSTVRLLGLHAGHDHPGPALQEDQLLAINQ